MGFDRIFHGISAEAILPAKMILAQSCAQVLEVSFLKKRGILAFHLEAIPSPNDQAAHEIQWLKASPKSD